MEKRRLWDDKVALWEDLIGGLFLLALAIVPVAEIVLRRLTGSGLVWSSGFLQHVVVWAAWVGGITASREGSHLALSSANEKKRRFTCVVAAVRDIGATAVNMAFAVASASFLVLVLPPETP